MNEPEAREELARVCKMMYDRGLTFASGGNVSVRLEDGDVLITPSGKNKGLLRAGEMVRMGKDGDVIGPGRPSVEVHMHLEYYRRRPDVGAIVHSHPPYCTALALAGERLLGSLTPEGAILLGEVPLSPYGTPGTKRLVDSVAENSQSNALLMEKHGAFAAGEDLMAAFNRMEEMEFHARLQHILGEKAVEFDDAEVNRIKGG